MSAAIALSDRIHAQALEASTRYKRAEVELISILQQVEEHRVFLARGHASLFAYVTRELGLAENVAYNLITVARKAREVPELKIQLQAGAMTLSNARRVAAVLTPSNQEEWIQKAVTLSNRQLEREIVLVRPQEATPERTAYVTLDRIRLTLGLSEAQMLRLRRAQDLVSQSRRRAVSLEETLEELTDEFLRRHDPLEKAKRHRVRKGAAEEQLTNENSDTVDQHQDKLAAESKGEPEFQNKPEPLSKPQYQGKSDPRINTVQPLVTRRVIAKRAAIPAAVLHQVTWRDRRRCVHLLPDGTRCNQRRWIEIHHIKPVSEGGENTVNNLTTLCSAHHKLQHRQHPQPAVAIVTQNPSTNFGTEVAHTAPQ